MKKKSIYKQTEWDAQNAKNAIAQKAYKKIETKSVWRIRLFLLLSSALGGSAIITHYENTQIKNEMAAIKLQQIIATPQSIPIRYSPYKVLDRSESCSGTTQIIGEAIFCSQSHKKSI